MTSLAAVGSTTRPGKLAIVERDPVLDASCHRSTRRHRTKGRSISGPSSASNLFYFQSVRIFGHYEVIQISDALIDEHLLAETGINRPVNSAQDTQFRSSLYELLLDSDNSLMW